MQKPILAVVCAVIVSKGLILAVQRNKEQSYPGLWEFPGGKIEANESEQEALIREIEEELLLNIRLTMRLKPVSYEEEERVIELRPYYAEIAFGELSLQEHASYKWLAVSELNKLNWAPADLPVVFQVRETFRDV